MLMQGKQRLLSRNRESGKVGGFRISCGGQRHYAGCGGKTYRIFSLSIYDRLFYLVKKGVSGSVHCERAYAQGGNT